MRILIDLLHPAHVHVFRAIGAELCSRGHEVFFTARDKDVTVHLIEEYGLPATVISRHEQKGLAALAREMVQRTRRLTRIALQLKPDVLMGIMGPTVAVVGRLVRRPSVVLYDTEHATLTNRWVYPLSSYVLTPDCYRDPVPGSHITYPGYHELAYLHPDRFKPNASVLREFNVAQGEPYFVMRFVNWKASHDLADTGLSEESKLRLFEALQVQGRVLITAEGPLPARLESCRLTGPIGKVHHLLAYARAYVGESATMASEAAVLGTPAFYVAEHSRGYLDDLAGYGLVSIFQPSRLDSLIAAFADVSAITHPDARNRMLDDKVDTASWIVNWLEHENTRL